MFANSDWQSRWFAQSLRLTILLRSSSQSCRSSNLKDDLLAVLNFGAAHSSFCCLPSLSFLQNHKHKICRLMPGHLCKPIKKRLPVSASSIICAIRGVFAYLKHCHFKRGRFAQFSKQTRLRESQASDAPKWSAWNRPIKRGEQNMRQSCRSNKAHTS